MALSVLQIATQDVRWAVEEALALAPAASGVQLDGDSRRKSFDTAVQRRGQCVACAKAEPSAA
jgi:hypothetical protein